jgi:hypothetical protein
MPSVLRADGYRFFFYSDEGNPREPPHIDAASGERAAKFWLEPVELVKSKRLSASEITVLAGTRARIVAPGTSAQRF